MEADPAGAACWRAVGIVAVVWSEDRICQDEVVWPLLRDYQKHRICTLLDPTTDPLGKGFHIIQGMIAIGSGGVTGKGFMSGTQTHLEFIPERTTDFIFAAFSEEFGMLGALLLLFGFTLLIFRGLAIAADAPSVFTRLLAGSITLSFFTYAFVNMGMVSGILPVVGVPLPFVSYGGTAMVTLGLGLGFLTSIAEAGARCRPDVGRCLPGPWHPAPSRSARLRSAARPRVAHGLAAAPRRRARRLAAVVRAATAASVPSRRRCGRGRTPWHPTSRAGSGLASRPAHEPAQMSQPVRHARPRHGGVQRAHSRRPTPVIHVTPDGFGVVYLVDRGDRYQWLTRGELADWGRSEQQAHAVRCATSSGSRRACATPGSPAATRGLLLNGNQRGEPDAARRALGSRDRAADAQRRRRLDRCARCLRLLRRRRRRGPAGPAQLGAKLRSAGAPASQLITDRLFVRRKGRWQLLDA